MPAPARAKERQIKTAPNVQPTKEAESLPLEERIRRRAYELYIERGSETGSGLDDWLRAEDEIRSGLEQQREAEYA